MLNSSTIRLIEYLSVLNWQAVNVDDVCSDLSWDGEHCITMSIS